MRISKLVQATLLCVALAACGDDREHADISSVGVTTSSPPTTEATTTVPTTTVVTTTRPSTTVRRPTGSTAAVTTTTRGAGAGPLPTSTTPSADRPPCSPSLLAVEVATDRATYRPGETVMVQATLRNRSGAPCYYTSYAGGHRIDGPGGQPVRPLAVFIADAFRDTPLAAGATLTQSPTWDQQACPASPGAQCAQAAPGTYTVTVEWRFGGEPAAASASFRLAAA